MHLGIPHYFPSTYFRATAPKSHVGSLQATAKTVDSGKVPRCTNSKKVLSWCWRHYPGMSGVFCGIDLSRLTFTSLQGLQSDRCRKLVSVVQRFKLALQVACSRFGILYTAFISADTTPKLQQGCRCPSDHMPMAIRWIRVRRNKATHWRKRGKYHNVTGFK